MAGAVQPSLETLPQIPFEKILHRLEAGDVAALHVTSEKLFWRCEKFILHYKEKINGEAPENIEQKKELQRARNPWKWKKR